MHSMRNQKKRLGRMMIGGVTLVIGAIISYSVVKMVIKPPTSTTIIRSHESPDAKKPTNQTVRFAAFGDLLAHDSVVQNARTENGYDFTRYFGRLKPLYSRADVIFCNPETPAGSKLGVSGYPTFNAPDEFVRDLGVTPGCNMINLATNHINDKGVAGIAETLRLWEATTPLAIAGANRSIDEQNTVRYFTKNDIRFAFVAFADFSNRGDITPGALNLYHDEQLVRHLMGEARRNADAVIVSAHWGTEDVVAVNTDQQKTAQLFAELGADIVIGTGPHVLQSATWLSHENHKTLVWYSIGNMLSSQLLVDELTGGIAGFTVEKSTQGIHIKDIQFAPTYMAYDWPEADKTAGRLMTRTNLELYPLWDANDRVKRMFPNESAATRMQFVRKAIGDEAGISIIEKNDSSP